MKSTYLSKRQVVGTTQQGAEASAVRNQDGLPAEDTSSHCAVYQDPTVSMFPQDSYHILSQEIILIPRNIISTNALSRL